MYVCMYIHTYVYTYMCVYIYIYMYILFVKHNTWSLNYRYVRLGEDVMLILLDYQHTYSYTYIYIYIYTYKVRRGCHEGGPQLHAAGLPRRGPSEGDEGENTNK